MTAVVHDIRVPFTCPSWCSMAAAEHLRERYDLTESGDTFIHHSQSLAFPDVNGGELYVDISSVTRGDGTALEPAAINIGGVDLLPEVAAELIEALPRLVEQLKGP